MRLDSLNEWHECDETHLQFITHCPRQSYTYLHVYNGGGHGRCSRQTREQTKHQQRTEATRHALLEAALRIFARDGFEASRIEDIAGATGHTRGAFYAHFNSKEDLFFALFEQQAGDRLRDLRSMPGAVPRLRGPAARVAQVLCGARIGSPMGDVVAGVQAVRIAASQVARAAGADTPAHPGIAEAGDDQ